MNTKTTTLVFEGVFDDGKNPITEPHCGLSSVSWSQGDALDDKNSLLDFVSSICDGELVGDDIIQQANNLRSKII